MVSPTPSLCTDETVKGWSASTTRILWDVANAETRRTTDTDYEPSDLTNTRTRQLFLRTFGVWSTPCSAREE
jgi:hypothetical protein